MRIYATYNIKGGVGKTTTAVNLAYLAAESGLRTVLWDLDPQGAASFMFRVKPKVKGGGRALISGKRPLDDAIKGTDFDNLDLIPADFTYRNMDLLLDLGDAKAGDDAGRQAARKLAKLLAPLAAEYDAVFLDCPPSVSLVSENVLHAADVIVVPLIPTTLSVRTLEQLSDFVARVQGAPPGDPRRSSRWSTGARSCTGRSRRSCLPNGADVAPHRRSRPCRSSRTMSVERAPVTVFAPRSAAARAYRALWSEIQDRAE